MSKRVTADFRSLKRAVKTKIGSLEKTRARALKPEQVQAAIDALDSALVSIRGACTSMRREFVILTDAEVRARRKAPSGGRRARKTPGK